MISIIKKKGLILLLILCAFTNLNSEDIDDSNWGKELGLMSWNAGDKKCKSLGMRLPEEKDFDKAKENGMMFQFAIYWISEEPASIPSRAYTYKIVHRFKAQAFLKDGTEGFYGVKCIK